jgi:Methyltransferase domain
MSNVTKASSLSYFIENYQNNLECNDKYHAVFTNKTNEMPLLKDHRDYIERNKLGFGDRAFHYMWYLLLEDLKERFDNLKLLEIGVYKGQVISLWSLLKRKKEIPAKIFAISPLEGNIPNNKLLNNRVVNKLKKTFDTEYRKCVANGNNYLIEDYEGIVRLMFERLGLSYDEIKMLKGYSNDPAILSEISKEKFNLIYIDGDHSYDGVLQDIKNFTPLVAQGGYLVMDDASWFLDGSVFWKGHKEVSRACEGIEDLGFKNVLNIGHNRVYEKL